MQIAETPQPPPLKSGWSQVVRGKAVAAEDATQPETSNSAACKVDKSAKPDAEPKTQQNRSSTRAGGRHGDGRKPHADRSAGDSKQTSRVARADAKQSDIKQSSSPAVNKAQKQPDTEDSPAEETKATTPKVCLPDDLSSMLSRCQWVVGVNTSLYMQEAPKPSKPAWNKVCMVEYLEVVL